jgi:hypothetical protein
MQIKEYLMLEGLRKMLRKSDFPEEKIRGNGRQKIPFKLFTKNREHLIGNQHCLLLNTIWTNTLFLLSSTLVKKSYERCIEARSKEEAEKLLINLIFHMNKSDYPEI